MPFAAFYHVAEAKKNTLSPTKKRKQPLFIQTNGNNNNNNEENSSIYIEKRMRDRKAAMTEGEITISAFLKTFFLYELPPPFIGGFLCKLIDGGNAAAGRLLTPPSNTPVGWFAYLFANFVGGSAIWACILAFMLKTDEETEWSIVEPLQMIVYYVLWKFTLSAKHALSNKLDHHGLYGMNSGRYIKARRLERMQFACWVMDNGSNQPGAVLEELYTASLRNDCDLSKLHFDVGSETIARNITKHVVRWKLKAATSLVFQGKEKDIPTWHPQHPNHINMKVLKNYRDQKLQEIQEKQQEQSINIISSSLPTIDNVETNDDASSVKIENNNIVVEKTIEIKKDEEEKENRIKNNTNPYLVKNNKEEEGGKTMDDGENKSISSISSITDEILLPTLSVSKYAEDDNFCLFREYFKNTNDPNCEYVENLLQQGKVPASYVCFLIGVENWRSDMNLMGKANGCMVILVFLMAFMPAICRAIYTDEHLAFGKSQNAQYVFGFGFVGSLFPIFLLFGYLINCSLEMNFRFKASKFMKNILLPEGAYVIGATFDFEQKKKNKETKKKQKNGIRIRVSLRQSCNIVAWAAVRELCHGAAFCPFMHAKTQAYVASSFAAAILVTSVASFGAALVGDSGGGITVSLPAVINSFVFSVGLGIYVLLAYRVNFSTRYQRQEIAKARLAVLAEINDLEKRLGDAMLSLGNHNYNNNDNNGKNTSSSPEIIELNRQINSMHHCSMLLQVTDKQTTVSDHANPVKAMGLVADPAVLSIMLSILAASVWLEIQKISRGVMTTTNT